MVQKRQLGKRDTVGLSAPAISTDGSNPFGNGFWVARFDPGNLPRIAFEIYRMVTRGPTGCRLNLYDESRFLTGTAQASLNEWTAQGDAIPVDSGHSLIVYWNTALTPAPYLALYLQEA